MTKEVTIKKHNSLTDALTDLNLTSEKLLNALYLTWEREGYEDKTMTIPIADLKNIVGYNSNNDDYLYESLDQLTKSQRWRNFEYKGRGVKYHGGAFMSYTLYKDNYNYIDFNINPIVVSALKQKAGYTPLELKIVEKFITIGGYKLYQLFKRYEFLPNHTDSRTGEITFSVDELNNVLGTKYTYLSDIEKVIKRGLNEIKKIADIEIYHLPKKKEKEITFAWSRKSPYLQTMATFMEHMRKYYKQEVVYSTDTRKIAINEDGLLYDKAKENQPFLTKTEATKTWQSMYKFALDDKLFCLKQGKLF